MASLSFPSISFGSGHPSEPVVAHIQAHSGVQKVPNARLTLFIMRNFLDAASCSALIGLIDAQRRPSTVSDHNGDARFRTSETCDLAPDAAPVATAEAAISAFAGLDPAFGEPMQGQRYAVGQEFKAHTDYFDPQGDDFTRYCAVAGNRTWTVMIYLNRPDAGGATRFKEISKIVQPEAGKLLAWNNLLDDGSPNGATLHHGMKVRAGTKYVITKWFRERPWG